MADIGAPAVEELGLLFPAPVGGYADRAAVERKDIHHGQPCTGPVSGRLRAHEDPIIAAFRLFREIPDFWLFFLVWGFETRGAGGDP
jgi:hypothetical protein